MRRKPSRQAVTLKDLAQKTGFSINTVSRALREKDDISAETIQLIKAAAREMGYVNNTIASSLRLGYTNTIAVILGDISNPHFAIMTKEIENRARENGYTALILNTNENSGNERRAIQTAIHKNVDGILICPCQETEENLRFLLDAKIPFVQIGRKSALPADFVVCDDIAGGYQAASHLLNMGHRRILFLNAPTYISSARERQEGFEKAFRDRGLSPDPSLIREISISESNVSTVMEDILQKPADFTAVFAFSDSIAWEVWTCLSRHQIRVPQDCSLIGFDHIQSRMAIPFALTTISSYKSRMSVTALDYLLEQIQDSADKISRPRQLTIETKLVPGETVKKISGNTLRI